MKSALVLGGTSFFGKKLVQLLLDKEIEVTIATRGKSSDPFGDQVNRLLIERENKESLEMAVGDKKWDVCFDQTCYSPQEALDVSEILKGKINKLVFTSSGAVYDFGATRTEEDFDPYHYKIDRIGNRKEYIGLLGYQEAKRAAEAIYFQQATFPVVAVRFPFVIGTDDYTNRFKFHVDNIVDQTPMYIPYLQTKLDFITSDDAAQFIYWLAEGEQTGPFNGSFDKDILFEDLIHLIEEVVGKKAIITDTQENNSKSSPYVLPGDYSLDSSKASEEGFIFSKMEESLHSIIQYYFKQKA
jgi:nucleoside-diphosphate-sugar epimerase